MTPKSSKATGISRLGGTLSRRIGDLKRERAQLEEEILQLRAAAQIWSEVNRQIRSTGAGPDAFKAGAL